VSPRLDPPYWVFAGAGGSRLFAVRYDAWIDPSLVVLPPSAALRWLDRWLLDPLDLRELLQLYASLYGPLSPSPWGAFDVALPLEHRLSRAIEHGDLLILESRLEGVAAGPEGPEPPEPPSQPLGPPRPMGDAWIEVELLDYANQRYATALRLTPPSSGPSLPTFQGFVRVEDLVPGTCDIEFPAIDGREWGVAPTGANSGIQSGFVHTVGRGECISSLSRRFGFASWRTVWDDVRNASLRSVRKNPNALRVGEALFVPDPDPRIEQSPTNRRATYRTIATPTRLRIRFEGRSVNDYELRVEGQVRRGQVGPGGMIDEPISGDATSGELILRPTHFPGQEDRWTLELGALEPVSELRGVQARLDNLGFHCPVDGEASEQTTRAIAAYQIWRGVGDGTGQLDDATRADLETFHDG
jgi:hypothetical protein